jgi:hypothetical protein
LDEGSADPDSKGFFFPMKYTILINQKALVDNGFNIDLTDAAILNYFVDFMFTGKMQTIVYGNDLYYRVSYAEVLRQMPLLRTKEKDSVYRRFKRLSEAGLLIPYPDNQKLAAAFFRITDHYQKVLFSTEETETPRIFAAGPTAKTPGEPTAKTPDNNTISLKTISIKEAKIKFCKKIIDWATNNLNKYPKLLYFDFAKYWTEQSETGKMRFQDQKFFEIGRRLATWFENSDNKKLSDQWQAETKTETINSLLRKLL